MKAILQYMGHLKEKMFKLSQASNKKKKVKNSENYFQYCVFLLQGPFKIRKSIKISSAIFMSESRLKFMYPSFMLVCNFY